jgi:hypothetical protein
MTFEGNEIDGVVFEANIEITASASSYYDEEPPDEYRVYYKMQGHLKDEGVIVDYSESDYERD